MGNAGSLSNSANSVVRPLPTDSTAHSADPAAKEIGLRGLWAAWKRTARKIGDFQARVLLTIFYFLLLAPFAMLMRRTSDPLTLKPGTQRGWAIRQEQSEYTVEMARKQF